MDFRPNINPVDVIKKGAFGGTYFRDIYSCINNKWYRDSWKEFKELQNIDGRYHFLIFIMLMLINMVLNAEQV